MKAPLGALVACALTAGCAGGPLDPPYHRPTPPAPSAFPAGPAYGPQADDAAPTPWRSVFVGQKLRGTIELALSQSRDLRIAVAQVDAAQAQFHTQRAALLPTINGTGTATYAREFAGFPLPGGSSDFNLTEYAVSAGTTSFQLDLFGKIHSLTRAAFEQYLATRQGRRNQELTLIAQTATDWLTLASDESLLQVAQTTLKSGQTSLDLANARLNGGVGTGLDVANARTIVEQAKSDIGRYQTQVAQDRNALNLVVGATVPDALLPRGMDDPDAALPKVPGALKSDVLLRRPDVLQAEDQLRAAKANIGAARAAFFPEISLTGQGGSTTAALTTLFAPGTAVWAFMPTISVPIFAGGANMAGLAYAKAQDRIAVATYEKAIQSAFRETADALAAQGVIADRLAAQQGLVNAAAESLQLATALYDRGQDTYLDVLTAQRTLYSAQQSLVSTQLIAANNVVTLYKVLGGGYGLGSTSKGP
jgi:multidrug efflux system outer membrane protein